jgi:serine/threonine protein kinase
MIVLYRTVHLCCRLSDKKLVIIKQIPVEQMTKEERQAALNEVKVLSMLHHINIIEYYENFLEDKALMIVMEYAQGTVCWNELLSTHFEGLIWCQWCELGPFMFAHKVQISRSYGCIIEIFFLFVFRWNTLGLSTESKWKSSGRRRECD